MISFTVYGVPAPKGSKSAFPIRKGGKLTGRVAVVEGKTARQKDWSRRVEEVVQGQAAAGVQLLDGPLKMHVRFYLPRPVSAPKRRRPWPVRKPDIAKLLRALLDPMTGVLIADDARVVDVHAVKDYAEMSDDPRPRAEVRVWQLGEQTQPEGEEVTDVEQPGPERTGAVLGDRDRAGKLPVAP